MLGATGAGHVGRLNRAGVVGVPRILGGGHLSDLCAGLVELRVDHALGLVELGPELGAVGLKIAGIVQEVIVRASAVVVRVLDAVGGLLVVVRVG